MLLGSLKNKISNRLKLMKEINLIRNKKNLTNIELI